MFERFTPRARQVVVLAQDEARDHGHPYIGSEHILVGLIRERDGIAAEVIRRAGLNVDDVRAKLPPGEKDRPIGQIPFLRQAVRVLEAAGAAADSMNHSWVGTEHLLLGLVIEEGNLASQILGELGVAPTSVHERVRARLSGEARPRGE